MALADETVLAFVPAKNEKRADATGAFQPEAHALIKRAQGGEVVVIDNGRPFAARRALVLGAMAQRRNAGFSSVAFFCHGWSQGMQLGFRVPHVASLAAAIFELTGNPSVVVPLYCCSTGSDSMGDAPHAAGYGEGSFADRLRDALCAKAPDCSVFAHTTKGHTTCNPHVIVFAGMGITTGGVGGFAPVAPGSLLWRTWAQRMRAPKETLRYRAPYMSLEQIHDELRRAQRREGGRPVA